MTDGTHRLHLALTALQAGMAGLAAEDADLEPLAVETENNSTQRCGTGPQRNWQQRIM